MALDFTLHVAVTAHSAGTLLEAALAALAVEGVWRLILRHKP